MKNRLFISTANNVVITMWAADASDRAIMVYNDKYPFLIGTVTNVKNIKFLQHSANGWNTIDDVDDV